MNLKNDNRQTTSAGRTLRITAFGLAVLALGLLLWVRFLIVTDHPRTAIAHPAAQAAAGQDAPQPNR